MTSSAGFTWTVGEPPRLLLPPRKRSGSTRPRRRPWANWPDRWRHRVAMRPGRVPWRIARSSWIPSPRPVTWTTPPPIDCWPPLPGGPGAPTSRSLSTRRRAHSRWPRTASTPCTNWRGSTGPPGGCRRRSRSTCGRCEGIPGRARSGSSTGCSPRSVGRWLSASASWSSWPSHPRSGSAARAPTCPAGGCSGCSGHLRAWLSRGRSRRAAVASFVWLWLAVLVAPVLPGSWRAQAVLVAAAPVAAGWIVVRVFAALNGSRRRARATSR